MKIMSATYLFKALLAVSILFSALTVGFVQAQSPDTDSSKEAISQAELEQLLAPIALYPDTILSHILVASTYPLEVVQAERWALKHSDLQGQDAVEAAAENDWDPSVQALVAFPQVLKRLSQDLKWTQRLGDAFLQDEEQVLTSVQNLRELAEEAGSLDEMEKVTVSRDDSSIIIEPREREIVYLPYYDTRTVYGPWRWRHHQPTYWDYPYANSLYYDDYYRRNPFYWGPRISLSFGFFSNTFHWRNRHLVRISPRYYRPHRYYGHRDIIRHRHAQRWVHNSHRRHGHRNRHVDRRNNQSQGAERVVSGNNQIHRDQIDRSLNQQQIRERLIDRRDRHQGGNSTRRVAVQQNRSVTKRNRSFDRSSVRNQPRENSRVALPERARAVENYRRAPSRPATQPVNRATPAPARSQARSAPRPARQPQANRPTATPKPRATERRSAPAKARAGRSERRQPR